ncbi:MAG: DNA repair protein RecN [Pseudomonadota bacterium]
MLQQLTVTDFALVRRLSVDWSSGLTVITGESGAGKSILLGALGMVLGERASADRVRQGASRADISAEFDITGNSVAESILASHELADADEPGRCLLRRVITKEGRSRAFINGVPVNRGDLATLASTLVDIHAQDDHQRLLKRDVQLMLLDDFGVKPALRESARDTYVAWRTAAERREALLARLGGDSDRAALLEYQVEELDGLGLRPDEMPRLEAEHRRLAQLGDLQAATDACLGALGDGNPIAELSHRLQALSDEHPSLAAAQDLLSTAEAHVDEAAAELRHYRDSLDGDPEAFARAEARLALLHEHARKHRVEPEALAEHHQRVTDELAAIRGGEAELASLADEVASRKAAFEKAAAKLSNARKAAVKPFCKAVSEQMSALGIAAGELGVAFHDARGPGGLESIEFTVRTNPKQPAGPLQKIASGGERARIALAIQVVAAERTNMPTLVLDEADVGVGGTTADTLGRLLRDLSANCQVLCVTHAPQVAALGHQHLLVQKDKNSDSSIVPLDDAERIDEVARMLGGAEISAETTSYAKTLISQA